MAAERDRRKQILDTQALVNVAEGHKQRVILESEGGGCILLLIDAELLPHDTLAAFQSQMNQSAAQKQKLILESEGFLGAAVNEGEAIARQVDTLARTLASPSTEPTPADKAKALEALLELRRLEQLKAIAAGAGNSTYFFGDAKGSGKDAYDVDNLEKWKKNVLDYRGAP